MIKLLQMIKFEHSVFALPFAVTSAIYASHPDVDYGKFAWIFAAMVSARSAAMAFNRIVDAAIDARNPRTQDRHIPKGLIGRRQAWAFLAVMVGLFVLSAGMLNPTCLMCSPGVLVILFGYSMTKRLTWLCHFVLGISLGLAPLGAWVAIREKIELFPALLGCLVVFWVGGFDIIYSALDADFDRREGLYSIPARFGIRAALIISGLSHAICVGVLIALNPLDPLYLAAIAPVIGMLVYQHAIVRPGDLARANVAFFNANVVVGLGVMVALLLGLYYNGPK